MPHQLLAVHVIKPEFAVFRDPCFSDRELILEVLNETSEGEGILDIQIYCPEGSVCKPLI